MIEILHPLQIKMEMNENLDSTFQTTTESSWKEPTIKNLQAVNDESLNLNPTTTFEQEEEEAKKLLESWSLKSPQPQQQIKNIKEKLRDKADDYLVQAGEGSLDTFFINKLYSMITDKDTDDKVKLWALAEFSKIAWYKDNPKITIIQSWLKNMTQDEVLTY